MITYRSRISVRFVMFLAFICLISFVIPVLEQKAYHYSIIPILIFAVIFLALKSIKYVIDGEKLKIFYFWGIHQDIDIKKIRKIEPSCSLLSSPAGSLRCIVIYYNKYDEILISPRNQEDFIKQLIQINSNIQL